MPEQIYRQFTWGSSTMKATQRAMDIEYAIADILYPARELENSGIEITKLHIGDPNKFDFETPRFIKEALCRAVERMDQGYADPEGVMELREAIAEKERRKNGLDVNSEDVYVTAGVTEALQLTMAALLNPGDEMLVPGPGYPPYNLFINYYEGVPVSYRTDEEDDWQPDLDDLRKRINPRTKGVVVINPNNPTGAVYSRKTLEQMVNIAGEYGIPLISDEIYDLMTFEGEHFSPATAAKDVPVLLFNGFSKTFLVPGWRIGYMVFVDEEGRMDELKNAILRQLGLRISANVPCQLAAAEALRGPWDFMEKNRTKLRERSHFAYRRLNEIPGISVIKPKAAFYIFPKLECEKWKNDRDFVLDALNHAHVTLVPGSGFCSQFGKGHFRSVTLPDLPLLERAFDQLERFMRQECV
jgi:alanine-synthesizing transaminase